GRFPQHPREVPSGIVTYIAQQLDLEPEAWSHYDWHGRAIKYHRAQIRQELGVREATVADGEALSIWLGTQVLSSTHRLEHVREALYQRCRELRLEPPTPERVERLIRAALHQFETQLGERILEAVRKLMSNKSISYKSLKVRQETDYPVSPFLALLRIRPKVFSYKGFVSRQTLSRTQRMLGDNGPGQWAVGRTPAGDAAGCA